MYMHVGESVCISICGRYVRPSYVYRGLNACMKTCTPLALVTITNGSSLLIALWTASDSQGGQCPSYWSECSNEAGFNCQTDQDCAFNMKCCASHKCGKICVFSPTTRYKFPAYLWPSFLKGMISND